MQIVTPPAIGTYYNLYTLATLEEDTSVLITNVSSDFIHLVVANVQPLSDDEAFSLAPGQTVTILGTDRVIWVRCEALGPIVVQPAGGAVIPSGALPVGVFVGTQAITTQSLTEANCKNGRQYELGTYVTAVPNTAPNNIRDFIVITGNDPIILKNRIFQFTGNRLTLDIYRNPTYTNGTGTPISYYNLNDIDPVPGTVQIIALPTVTAVGTQIAPTVHILGNIPQGGQALLTTQAENSVQGLERVFRPNTTYLLRTTNNSTSAIDISSKTTWYEGFLSSRAV